MGLKAVFVGINKHLDPAIPELGGARRDATALWALFSDTFSDIAARPLLDEDATVAAVSDAIMGSLETASPDDVVVVTFAGHGSPGGSLILYDTDPARLNDTALSMARLAEAFKASKARAVLCILDCCFSGQAPARVLETQARPRNAFVFTDIHGEGRVLLAACATDEAAWEQPGTGHGLLTYATIQALTDPAVSSIKFPEIGGAIMRHARAEGERIGVQQTPVFLGSVQGGLDFPVFVRGANFQASFPAHAVKRVTGRFQELADQGFARAVVDQWSASFSGGLNSLQLAAANDHGVLDGKNLLVVAPTSSGKTLIGEMAALQAVAAGRKAVFLLPYRALVNEKFEDFAARFGPAGVRVVRCSGDAADGVSPVMAGRYDIAFFTYEMFLNMALVSPRLLNQLGLVVVDEGQFITDPSRGITVELTLALLRRARSRGIDPQLIILSAVIGRLNGFDEWLDMPVLRSQQRPVPLIEGVLDRTGIFQFLDIDGATKTEQLVERGWIVQRRDKPSSQDVIVPLAQKLVAAGEKLIVFRNTRGPAQGCARYLAKELGLPPATAVLAELPAQDLTGASEDLRHCLEGGTAFHNTNLLRAEKEAIERGYRNPAGGIHALAATTTLAAGINTPASTVILAENEFVGEDGRPFTIAEYKNMAGRAGRLGFNETGKAIILADNGIERAQLFQKYVLGKPEDVVSSFSQRNLPTWTLRLLTQVRGVEATEIPGLLVNTFGGYTASRADSGWVPRVHAEIGALVKRLIDAGLAEKEGEIVHLTMLGRACGSSSLSFESALRLIELVRPLNPEPRTAINLLAVIQVLPEMDGVYTPVMKRGQSESARANEVARQYGPAVMRSLQRFIGDEWDFPRRCKRAAILFDWIDGVSVEVIEKRYSPNPFQGVVSYGDIARIADAARFHLRSASQILKALMPEKSEVLAAVDTLIARLEFGLPADALSLLDLPLSLVRGQYLALHAEGARSPEAVAVLSDERLAACVGALAAARLRVAA